MIKFGFLFSFLMLYFSVSVQAQVPDSLSEEQGDTLETIISDSSIIYVIQKKPITIRERVEIVRAKIKIPFYLSIGFSILQLYEKRKPVSSYEDYTDKVNSSTKNKLGYSLGVSLWRCPKKNYYGLSVDLTKLQQQFQYVDVSGATHNADNRINYVDLGIQAGYWFRKNKNFSFIAYGTVGGEYLLSYSGFTFDKINSIYANRLDYVMAYNPYLLNLSAHLKLLFALKYQMIELEPFFALSPLSATSKKEVYSIHRSIIGIRIGLTNKLF